MIRIENNIPFDAVHTFECGQCFRWNADADGVYTGISGKRVCKVNGRDIICSDEDNEYWREYFALDVDYNEIISNLLSIDVKLSPCVDFGSGIRILKQDVWEAIISFIISANNNIPRIKKIIEQLCQSFGEKTEFDGEAFYSFPTPERLAGVTCEELAPLKAGYRDKYIIDAAEKVSSGEVDLNSLPQMKDDELKKTLMKIKGIGGKVADCVMLFSLGRSSVFPTDVWIKRIVSRVYGVEEKEIQRYVGEKYGRYAGYAQQYMYYYYRTNSL